MTYHAQSNGYTERWHRALKATIMYDENPSWTQSLPIFYLDCL